MTYMLNETVIEIALYRVYYLLYIEKKICKCKIKMLISRIM